MYQTRYSKEIHAAKREFWGLISRQFSAAAVIILLPLLPIAAFNLVSRMRLEVEEDLGRQIETFGLIIQKFYTGVSLPPEKAFSALAILAAIVLTLSLGTSPEVIGKANYGRAVFNYEMKERLLIFCGFSSSFIALLVVTNWVLNSKTGTIGPSLAAVFMALIVHVLTAVRSRRDDLEKANLARSLERRHSELDGTSKDWDERWPDGNPYQRAPYPDPTTRLWPHMLKIGVLFLATWAVTAVIGHLALPNSGGFVGLGEAVVGVFVWVVIMFGVPLTSAWILFNYRFRPDNILAMIASIFCGLLVLGFTGWFAYLGVEAWVSWPILNLVWIVPLGAALFMFPAFRLPRKFSWTWWRYPLKILQDAQWAVAERLEGRRRRSLARSIESLEDEISAYEKE